MRFLQIRKVPVFDILLFGYSINGGRTRNYPFHDMEKWENFHYYNQRDIEVELSIRERLRKYPMPDFVWDEYHRDQIINDRGIDLDMMMVDSALAIDTTAKEELTNTAKSMTGLENPNSVKQLTEWLNAMDIRPDSLDKKAVADLLTSDIPDLAKEILRIRQLLAKSSVKKHQAMQSALTAEPEVCSSRNNQLCISRGNIILVLAIFPPPSLVDTLIIRDPKI